MFADGINLYRKSVKKIGMNDHQISIIENNFLYDFFEALKFLILIVMYFTVSFPGLVLYTPLGVAMNYLAEKERIKCLKASNVKILGNDVVTSYKMVLGFVFMPVYWTI